MCKTELIFFLFFKEETDVHKAKYQLQIIACFQMLGLPKRFWIVFSLPSWLKGSCQYIAKK